MSYVTHKKFLERVKSLNMPYWNEGKRYRWVYMSYVINQLKKLGCTNIIEAGANFIPLNSSSFQIELEKNMICTGRGKVIDLNNTPYPLPEKHFDAAVALQVWEHLDKQKDAFNEFCRVAKNVILSFPYKWNHGDSRHRGIDDDKISEWTGGLEPSEKMLIKDRIIYTWVGV